MAAGIVLEKRPEEVISGETSPWNAVGNPVTYRIQRKDFTFDSIDDLTPGNPVNLKITGMLVAAAVNAALNLGTPIPDPGTGNPTMYVKFDTSLESGFYQLTTAAFESGGSTYIPISHLFGADLLSKGVNTGGFINGTGLANFGIEFEIADPVTGDPITSNSFIQSADASGKVLLNVAPILRAFLLADNNLNLVTANWAGTPYAEELTKAFYIWYRMVWDGSAESYTFDNAHVCFVALAALNIPAPYGPNLAQYCSFPDGTPKAKWLTRMAKPVMWKDWPFSASCIVGDLGVDFYFNVKKDGADSEDSDAFPADNTIQQVSLKGISGVTDDTEEIELRGVAADSADTVVTETLLIEVRHACQNPVMLLGRNALGGPLYWLFGYRQVYTFVTADGRKVKEMVLVADELTPEQWTALQDFIRPGTFYDENIQEFTSETIKTRNQVGNQLYVLDQDGNKIGVTIVPTDSTTNTRKVMNLLEITIQFPEEFLA